MEGSIGYIWIATRVGDTIGWVVFFGLVLCLVIGAARAASAEIRVQRHWSHLVDGLTYSTKEFYASLTQALEAREIPNTSVEETEIFEGAAHVSATRLYLRVKRGEEYVDICAAPFGRGFFFSSWLVVPPSALRLAPVIGWVIALLSPATYYRLDTAAMFHDMVHGALLECIDGVACAKGIRALSGDERKPILREFFKR